MHFATYDYAKAPDVIIRAILNDSLGPPVQIKTGKAFRGYVIRKADAHVGVKKITFMGHARPPCA